MSILTSQFTEIYTMAATIISNECPGYGDNLRSLISTMFLKRNETSDFYLECEGKRIPCHKIILAASSPVFKAMIRSRMKESQEDLMEISNFSFDTIITVVLFIEGEDTKSTKRQSHDKP